MQPVTTPPGWGSPTHRQGSVGSVFPECVTLTYLAGLAVWLGRSISQRPRRASPNPRFNLPVCGFPIHVFIYICVRRDCFCLPLPANKSPRHPVPLWPQVLLTWDLVWKSSRVYLRDCGRRHVVEPPPGLDVSHPPRGCGLGWEGCWVGLATWVLDGFPGYHYQPLR